MWKTCSGLVMATPRALSPPLYSPMIAPSTPPGAANRRPEDRPWEAAPQPTLAQLEPRPAAIRADQIEARNVGTAQTHQEPDERGEKAQQRREDHLRSVAVVEDLQDRSDRDDREAVR